MVAGARERRAVSAQAREQLFAGVRAQKRSVGDGVERIARGKLVVLGRVRHELQYRPIGLGKVGRTDWPATQIALGIG